MGKVFSAMSGGGQNVSNAEQSNDGDSTQTEELDDNESLRYQQVNELSNE